MFYYLTKMTRQEDQKHIFNFAWPKIIKISLCNVIASCYITAISTDCEYKHYGFLQYNTCIRYFHF